MRPHAFVAMPFGTKQGPDGQNIDFNLVFAQYIGPALESAGMEVIRADQEERAGDIRTDMFQELLIADLVVADLTLPNPNVWYELGVRHALRARGVVIVFGGGGTKAFDVYTDRQLRYGLKDGAPDPATLASDIQKLTDMVKATMESWHGRKVSPVYHLLPNLQEPDWKSLRVGDVQEFWERHEAWENRVNLARKSGNLGDILILAEEAPVAAFRSEAWIHAGKALRKAGRFDFALEQLERGLAIAPGHLDGLREQGMCLQRLAIAHVPGHSLDRARAHYHSVLKQFPNDAETWALLGRVDKDAWVEAWRSPGNSPGQMKDDAAYEDALLRAAIESYYSGFRRQQSHYYSGINALTLMYLCRHLTGDARYEQDMGVVAGAVRFGAIHEPDVSQRFWALATLGDLEILAGNPDSVVASYKEAIASNDKSWFDLDSCRAQLALLRDLDFRRDNVEAGIATFDRALQKLNRPETQWQPRRVFLFSGHMIDAPDRAQPRFPSTKAADAAQEIGEALDRLGAGAEDLALTQGACGGDLLFTEACLQRNVKVNWLQPFREPDFIQTSVVCGGEAWRQRYLEAKVGLAAPIRCAPDELGVLPPSAGSGYPYERCNLWLLDTALAYGVDKVNFICLWNGEGGDGPGGTTHMYNEVKRRTGRVVWIDVRQI
jgi:tetratricopeptide (TPR) repeat protein